MRILLLFVTIPLIELMLLMKVGEYIGGLNTIVLVVTTGIVGGSLARMQGLHVLQQAQEKMARGEVPQGVLGDGLAILCGGLLLLTPGILTDLLGLALLFPPSRNVIKLLIAKRLKNRLNMQDRIIEIHTESVDEKNEEI
jgi:UPF0716 protein FxsA